MQNLISLFIHKSGIRQLILPLDVQTVNYVISNIIKVNV